MLLRAPFDVAQGRWIIVELVLTNYRQSGPGAFCLGIFVQGFLYSGVLGCGFLGGGFWGGVVLFGALAWIVGDYWWDFRWLWGFYIANVSVPTRPASSLPRAE
jgi:hypothetical protein